MLVFLRRDVCVRVLMEATESFAIYERLDSKSDLTFETRFFSQDELPTADIRH